MTIELFYVFDMSAKCEKLIPLRLESNREELECGLTIRKFLPHYVTVLNFCSAHAHIAM